MIAGTNDTASNTNASGMEPTREIRRMFKEWIAATVQVFSLTICKSVLEMEARLPPCLLALPVCRHKHAAHFALGAMLCFGQLCHRTGELVGWWLDRVYFGFASLLTSHMAFSGRVHCNIPVQCTSKTYLHTKSCCLCFMWSVPFSLTLKKYM